MARPRAGRRRRAGSPPWDAAPHRARSSRASAAPPAARAGRPRGRAPRPASSPPAPPPPRPVHPAASRRPPRAAPTPAVLVGVLPPRGGDTPARAGLDRMIETARLAARERAEIGPVAVDLDDEPSARERPQREEDRNRGDRA